MEDTLDHCFFLASLGNGGHECLYRSVSVRVGREKDRVGIRHACRKAASSNSWMAVVLSSCCTEHVWLGRTAVALQCCHGGRDNEVVKSSLAGRCCRGNSVVPIVIDALAWIHGFGLGVELKSSGDKKV